jgi:hypothetical protein
MRINNVRKFITNSHCFSVTKADHLKIFKEIRKFILVDYMKHINSARGQNTEFLNVTAGGNSCALKGKFIVQMLGNPPSYLM